MSSLDAVVVANRAVWEQERAVCRAYFGSPCRDVDSDLRWLERQAAKELHDGVHARRAAMADAADPRTVLHLAEELLEEARHFAAFATAYDRLRRPSDPALGAAALEAAVQWPANLALRHLRREHRARHGRLGALAALITEGGGAVLFEEGAALRGGGGADDVVADACEAVLHDEVRHMESGVGDLARLELDEAEWELVIELTVAQSRQRVRMREEQFGG